MQVGDKVQTLGGSGEIQDAYSFGTNLRFRVCKVGPYWYDERLLTPLGEGKPERMWPRCTAKHPCAWRDGVEDAICTYSTADWICRFAKHDAPTNPGPKWRPARIRRLGESVVELVEILVEGE